MSDKIVTPEFRGSFVYLNEPHSPPDSDDEKYSITVVLDKDDKEHMAFKKKIDKMAEAMRVERFGEQTSGKKYKYTPPVKDGDDDVVEQFVNSYIIRAKTSTQPGVVDKFRKPITDPKELYSGAWYRAAIELYPWSHATGGKGISASLSNVMKVRDDTAFDGRTSAEDDFADIDYPEDFEDDDDII